MTDYTDVRDVRIRTKICELMSQMLDNPDDSGIYPTSRFMWKMETFILEETKCIKVDRSPFFKHKGTEYVTKKFHQNRMKAQFITKDQRINELEGENKRMREEKYNLGEGMYFVKSGMKVKYGRDSSGNVYLQVMPDKESEVE